MNKHEAMWQWISECPVIDKLYYNFGSSVPNSSVFLPNASDRIVKRDIFGTMTKHYDFAVTSFVTVDTTLHTIDNLVNYTALQDFIDWVEEQNKLRNFPVLDDNCTVKTVLPLQNMPTNAGATTSIAKFMVQCRVVYLEMEE